MCRVGIRVVKYFYICWCFFTVFSGQNNYECFLTSNTPIRLNAAEGVDEVQEGGDDAAAANSDGRRIEGHAAGLVEACLEEEDAGPE